MYNMNGKVKLSRLQLREKPTVNGAIIETKPEPITTTTTTTNTTPVSRKNTSRREEDDEHLSPFFMRFTQDSGDDELDVVWDWESPRSKGNHSIHRKRLTHSSPNIKRKITPSNLPRFNSLKAELEKLANKVSDNSNSDKQIDGDGVFLKPNLPLYNTELPDLFDDDSLDEEMVRCSQLVEAAFNDQYENKHFQPQIIEDDSFDVFLEEVKEEQLSQASSSSNCSQNSLLLLLNNSPAITLNNAQTVPLNNPPIMPIKQLEVIATNPPCTSTASSPRSISRFNSVPMTNKTLMKPILSNFQRTKSEDLSLKASEIKCSPEEIEKKRQEARFKLEKKKLQVDIERKRLDAIERLKRNRMQRIKNTKLL